MHRTILNGFHFDGSLGQEPSADGLRGFQAPLARARPNNLQTAQPVTSGGKDFPGIANTDIADHLLDSRVLAML